MLIRRDGFSPTEERQMRKRIGAALAGVVFCLAATSTAKDREKGWEYFHEATGIPWGAENCGGKWEMDAAAGVFTFNAGAGWGCILSIVREGWPFNRKGAREIVAWLKVKKGVKFVLSVSEDGVADRNASSFEGKRGADGEVYDSEVFTGRGKKAQYVVNLAKMNRSPVSGNPKGNKKLDVQAFAALSAYVLPEQGEGYIAVYSIRFR